MAKSVLINNTPQHLKVAMKCSNEINPSVLPKLNDFSAEQLAIVGSNSHNDIRIDCSQQAYSTFLLCIWNVGDSNNDVPRWWVTLNPYGGVQIDKSLSPFVVDKSIASNNVLTITLVQQGAVNNKRKSIVKWVLIALAIFLVVSAIVGVSVWYFVYYRRRRSHPYGNNQRNYLSSKFVL